MKHGKEHRAEVAKSSPEWERKFLAYKALKKKVKLINPQSNGIERSRSGNGSNESSLPIADMGFTLLLDRELAKINAFYIDKEEDYIIRFREFQIKAENINGYEQVLQVQKEILDFHSEMVMLLRYSVINFTGLIKIMKKLNKKQGAYSVYLSYMPWVLQQPFFSTDLLYNLIKGCEAILTASPP